MKNNLCMPTGNCNANAKRHFSIYQNLPQRNSNFFCLDASSRSLLGRDRSIVCFSPAFLGQVQTPAYMENRGDSTSLWLSLHHNIQSFQQPKRCSSEGKSDSSPSLQIPPNSYSTPFRRRAVLHTGWDNQLLHSLWTVLPKLTTEVMVRNTAVAQKLCRNLRNKY